MPTVPQSTKCLELGCHNPKTWRSAFCDEHGGGQTEKGKKNNQLYSTAFWKKQRIIQLSKNPLCACCLLEGKVVAGEHIDHVFPHRQNNQKFKNNIFQTLCAVCHTNKTLEENTGVYLHFTANGIIKYTDTDYGYKIANQTEPTETV